MDKPLYIPPAKKLLRLGLTVFCYKCNTNVSEICKLTGNTLLKCPFGNRHSFKVYAQVPGTENIRKTKKLQTRDVNEAIKQAIEFQKEVKENNYPGISINENKRGVQTESKNIPQLIVHCIARYIGWLQNEGVPSYSRRRLRSPEHIKDIQRALKLLTICLRFNKYDLSKFTIDQLDDRATEIIYDYLENEKKFGNRSFNKHLTIFTSFIKWYGAEYSLPIKNRFELADRKPENPKPESIAQWEYKALLNKINPETGIKKYDKGKKRLRNMYQPWLKDGIRLALETGRRREEIISLKYSDIIDDDNGNSFIKVEDYKVNRIQNRVKEEEKKYIFIPVTDSLRILLNEIGYEKYKGTQTFILAPEVNISRTRFMSDALSRGFSHYYDQLNTGRRLTFKCLRKTYITNLSIYMGGNAKAITKHSDDDVIEKYYLDKKALVTAARGFNVFSNEVDRKNELEQLRNKYDLNQKELEVEK